MGDEYYELWGRGAYAPGFGLACHPGRGSVQRTQLRVGTPGSVM